MSSPDLWMQSDAFPGCCVSFIHRLFLLSNDSDTSMLKKKYDSQRFYKEPKYDFLASQRRALKFTELRFPVGVYMPIGDRMEPTELIQPCPFRQIPALRSGYLSQWENTAEWLRTEREVTLRWHSVEGILWGEKGIWRLLKKGLGSYQGESCGVSQMLSLGQAAGWRCWSIAYLAYPEAFHLIPSTE